MLVTSQVCLLIPDNSHCMCGPYPQHEYFCLEASVASSFSNIMFLLRRRMVSYTSIAFVLLCSPSVVSDSLWPHGLQHARLPCPSLSPRACSNSCPSSQRCHPTISSFFVPFSSHLQSFPASGSFPMSQFFTSGGQRIGVSTSASVLPMNIRDWFPLGWTGWISLQSKGSSKSPPKPQFKNINSLALCLLYGPILTSVQDYWKNHSFDYTDLCQQSDVSAF